MGKGRKDEGVGCSDRQLRKTIYDLVKSESVITVDNVNDPDPAGLLQIAREHFVGRVEKQAAERQWSPNGSAESSAASVSWSNSRSLPTA